MKKIKPGQKLVKISLSLIVVVFMLIFYFFYKNIQSPPPQQNVANQVLGSETKNNNEGFPMRLKIPKINVDASVEYVGLTDKGEMDVPSNTSDVALFKFGAYPGEHGSAVIAGHFDGENGASAVFTDLHKLQKGDKLYIDYANGISLVFVVRESRAYDPGYVKEVFHSSNTAHLNLVTCDGVWNKTKKSYSKRLVVFADITR
jgi:LPXTG-site transpeptidase (sortase) family protein